MLGVPAFRVNDFVGRISYLRELEGYGLAFGFRPGEEEQALAAVQEVVRRPDRREVFAERRRLMLAERIDPLPWLLDQVRALVGPSARMNVPPELRCLAHGAGPGRRPGPAVEDSAPPGLRGGLPRPGRGRRPALHAVGIVRGRLRPPVDGAPAHAARLRHRHAHQPSTAWPAAWAAWTRWPAGACSRWAAARGGSRRCCSTPGRGSWPATSPARWRPTTPTSAAAPAYFVCQADLMRPARRRGLVRRGGRARGPAAHAAARGRGPRPWRRPCVPGGLLVLDHYARPPDRLGVASGGRHARAAAPAAARDARAAAAGRAVGRRGA